jgi:hypothetical protein
MRGRFFLADDQVDPAPGVLVFPEAFGVGERLIVEDSR